VRDDLDLVDDADRVNRTATVVDGREAIRLSFEVPAVTHVGYRTIAAGAVWNVSFVATGPDTARQLETFGTILESLSIGSAA
jgi:hypothetical protein